jgi:prepilin-type N-terminal cleavage/methylation domain-containing protein
LGNRLRNESGFTLLELLIVLIVLGILTTIALPSYLTFKDNGRKAAAKANVKLAVTAMGAYANDNFKGAALTNDPDWNGTDAAGTGTNADNGWHNGNTGKTTLQLLQTAYNPSLPSSIVINPTGYTFVPDDSSDYCLYTTNGSWYAAWKGSSTAPTVGKTMTLSSCTAS